MNHLKCMNDKIRKKKKGKERKEKKYRKYGEEEKNSIWNLLAETFIAEACKEIIM